RPRSHSVAQPVRPSVQEPPGPALTDRRTERWSDPETMLALQRTLTRGYLAQHPTRAVLVTLCIALGVATLVATQALNRSLGNLAEVGSNPPAGLPDLLITNGQAGAPDDLARDLLDARLEGVLDAQPAVMARPKVVELGNRSVWLLGLDWSRWLASKKGPVR